MRKKDKMYPFIVPGFIGVMIFIVLPLADVFIILQERWSGKLCGFDKLQCSS